ncbi:uncharacterized protein LOC129287266 [Prosopis cineraria]|uniref:uncharacterized protein LOC129287266 n=1 Tax=Prosopis cineraria TaxID=364024 RepID=UPI00240F0F13|nr:uncharacterized protein LOC129287266 [Prosopis cineraria]
MMARIPVGFERVAAAFDADIARMRLCESSGSDHSPESSNTDLSDLVKSFMENNERGDVGGEEEARGVNDKGEEGDELIDVEKDDWSGSDEKKEKLKSLFEGNEIDGDDRNAKEKIRREVEVAYGSVGEKSSLEFRRRLMSRLRGKGFDAGLCKSKWNRNARFPGGDYEYIDINMGGKRYIVEVYLAGEFEIARPTSHYSSLLHVFPVIFVGRVEELKKIVRLMCTAIKASMKRADLLVPPWRRHGYVQAKWFSSYRRTANEMSTRKRVDEPRNDEDVSARWSIINGFEARSVKAYNCRDDYGMTKPGFRVGLLATALNS